MVTSVRLVAAGKGKVIAANNWGKLKTVSQIVAICVILFTQYLQELGSLGVLPWISEETAVLFWCIGEFSLRRPRCFPCCRDSFTCGRTGSWCAQPNDPPLYKWEDSRYTGDKEKTKCPAGAYLVIAAGIPHNESQKGNA